jgi:hypothetical protein
VEDGCSVIPQENLSNQLGIQIGNDCIPHINSVTEPTEQDCGLNFLLEATVSIGILWKRSRLFIT